MGDNSRPTIVKHSRRSVSIRTSRKGVSLTELLLDGKYSEALSKVRLEAHKEVCVKLDDEHQERWLLPLHVACALPNVPMSLILALAKAHPKALTHHTTLSKRCKLDLESSATTTGHHSLNKDVSTLSVTSSVVSTVSNAWGVGWLPLHVAVYYGAPLEIVEVLLEESPGSIYCKTTQGYLPLHVACTSIDSSHHLIESLVKAFPLSLYVSTSDGVTAQELAEVAAKGDYPACVGLLAPTPTSDTHSERSSRPMHNIPCTKRRSIFKKMVSTGRLDNHVNRETKLFSALSKKRWSIAREILCKKPKEARIWTLSPDPKDPPCHLLPLHMALRRKAPISVIKALLNANASAIYRREYYGMLPLHVACNVGLDTDIVELLCEASPVAARQPDLGGMLPLHLACSSKRNSRCNLCVITYLLGVHPKAVHVEDSKSNLPQDYLVGSPNQDEIMKEFERGDAFWAAKEIPKNKVAFLICQKQWDAALTRLLEAPEEATVWTVHPLIHLRYLPLHYACIVKAPVDLIRALLKVHPIAASIECQEYDMLPLHLACQHGATPSVVQALLETNTDAASVPDAFDLLPLHLACTQGASDVAIEALVEAYPSAVQAVDRNGHTPKVYAEAVVHPHSKKVIQLLEDS
mmetsp:Transcript_27272/g.45451  ORF Transcript_27272/g.45451 Transcript_27272/m.45451 type:complete len:635 (+) Transcript_27272:50-1954(+)